MTTNNEIESRLWEAADQLRANSGLKYSQFARPILGLIFLRYADFKFFQAQEELEEITSLVLAGEDGEYPKYTLSYDQDFKVTIFFGKENFLFKDVYRLTHIFSIRVISLYI